MTGRTLVVTNDFPPQDGGIQSFVMEVVRRLPAEQVVVHTCRQPGDRDHDAGLPFPVVRDRARLLLPTPALTRRVVRTLRRYGCDRVWFGSSCPLGLMAPALRRAGARQVVATTHGHEVWWAAVPGTRQLLRRVGQGCDVLTFINTHCGRRIAPALTPAARSRMTTLAPGVDSVTFHPGVDGGRVRQQYGLGEDPVIVCVSRLVARKGQDVLVRALPEVREAVPRARLLLVGDGPHRDALEHLVDRTGVREAVTFTGRVPWEELPACHAAGTVFAMPCRDRRAGLEVEGLGIVFLEAAATGRPVLVGASGGAVDAVLDGENGFLVDGTDEAQVAGRLITLLRDPELARRFGDRGRQWVQEEWQWQDRADTLARLLTPGHRPVPLTW